MKFDTYGDQENPVALLIHSIFYPGATGYRTMLPILTKKYYVIVPNLDGLSYPNEKFISTRCQAEKIINWLEENNIKHISFLLGSSYGTSIAFEILKDQHLEIDNAALDAPTLKNNKFKGLLLYFELKKIIKDVKKNGIKAFDNYEKYKYLNEEDKEYCSNVYKSIKKESLKDIAFECYDYTLPSQLYRKDTKVIFLFGEKDRAKNNLPEIKKLKSGDIKIIESMDHMQYMFEETDGFLKACGLNLN
ncbi:alpha/beta fold hydrolase [Peptostreptococcus faecalis]|uniref:alpha/beta fold hydrolase n=1 Tax=Peptostreptococcus faecalis TaxID=2045015 RepID=UPI000C7A4868|nr:alpha/beta hydrolase [Peptostreptococcus faecalis]